MKSAITAYALIAAIGSIFVARAVALLSREARGVIRAMIGDKPLSSITDFGLASSPVFYAFGAVFSLMVLIIHIRQDWTPAINHTLIVSIIIEAFLIFFCLFGIAIFFATLDYGMSIN